MKKYLKKYKHLISLALVVMFAVLLACLGGPGYVSVAIVALWQLSQFIQTKKCLACYEAGMLTPEQVKEFDALCEDLKAYVSDIKDIKKLRDEVRSLRKSSAAGGGPGGVGVRWVGNTPLVSDDCAHAICSVFVLDCAKLKGGLDSMIPDASRREQIIQLAANSLGIQYKAGGALSPTDIPLPTAYVPQIIELVFAYGQARKYSTVFPLGAGTVKLPRLKTGEDDFGFLGAGTAGQSQNVPQKEVQAELVTFTANKFGGLIRIPYEIEEDTFIPIGQFLARYIARQMAKGEDKTMFIADGTGTYANITGIATYCQTAVGGKTPYLQQLAAGKVKVTDATLADFRAMRGLVNPAVLANMAANGQTAAAYYLHPTLEALLVTFNTIGSPLIYRPAQGNQPATLDGWPIRWIGVSAPNNAQANPSAPIAFFGDLSYWYLGERGVVRIEISREVFFQTDEIAMRALERIDVEAMAIDAMSTLLTAAA